MTDWTRPTAAPEAEVQSIAYAEGPTSSAPNSTFGDAKYTPYRSVDPKTWNRALTLDLIVPRTLKLDSDGWDSLPKNYPWKFMKSKDPVGLVPIESPDQIDQIVETLTNLKSQTGLTLTRSKAIYKYFQSKRVLDPFVRRGDTALGAMAAGIQTYHGFTDQNLPIFNPRYDINRADFLSSKITESGYDTILTVIDRIPLDDIESYLDKIWFGLCVKGYLILRIIGEDRMIRYPLTQRPNQILSR